MNSNQDKTGKTWSLRQTLVITILSITLSLWVISGYVIYLQAEVESQELFDESLAETGKLLLTLANHEVQERLAFSDDEAVESQLGSAHSYLMFQIWDSNQKLLYKNKDAPNKAFNEKFDNRFEWNEINGERWRVFTLWDQAHQLHIQIGEKNSHRKEISSQFAYKLTILALIMLPLMAFVLWITINRLFSSINTSAKELRRRTANDLEELPIVDVPTELSPLLIAINQLFKRVDRAMEQEHRFTANASHELRTPLAAIKTNLQVIQRSRNEAERTEAIGGLAESVNRATHLIEQLLKLSRSDFEGVNPRESASTDIRVFLQAQLREFDELSKKKNIRLDYQLENVVCDINAESMKIALRNLVDNAVRYSSEGGRILISCGLIDGIAYLRISDNGPGIAEEMRQKVIERFFRLSDSISSGSGLGLSIVQSIVRSHRAKMILDVGLENKGLSVTIVFEKEEGKLFDETIN